MKTAARTLLLALTGGVWLTGSPILAQPVLAIDFNRRGQDPAATTQAGFDPFLIGTVGGATAVQSNATVQTIGAYTVTVSGSSPTITYDDRLRSTPTDSGDFTQSLLLRDFVFCGSTTTGTGLDIAIDGLTAGQVYQVTIWSFDTSSTGNRVSDWYANGTLAYENYIFNGSILPTNNTQYTFSFKATADAGGRLLLQGRRDAATSSAGSVFVNALTLETALPDAPGFPQAPLGAEVFAGDNVLLSCVATGTAPMAFQWYRDGTLVEGATNHTLVLKGATTNDAGGYQLTAANGAGTATSGVATVTVRAVERLQTGLISHWPFETIAETVPDATTNHNDLFPINMDASNLTNGRYGNALLFNGVDEYLMRLHTNSLYLPVYPYPAYTVCLWVKGIGTNQTDRRVYAEGSTNTQNTLLSVGTANVASNTVDIFIRNDNGVTPMNHGKTSLPAFDDTWHHIAWVDNNGFGTVYVDGVADMNNFNYVRGTLTPNVMAIGAVLRTNVLAYYGGAIDEVAVWRRALSAQEVQQVMNNALTPMPLRIVELQINGQSLTLTAETPEPAVPHQIWEAQSLPSETWTPVTNAVFSPVTGNRVSAQIPLPGGPQRYYRLGF